MKRYKKLLMIGATVMMIGTGCSNMALTTDQKVEQAFEKHLSIYPVKSLEDFYDMEGFRDGEFEKDDKGMWVLNSSISNQSEEDGPLITQGIVLYLDRNNNMGKGYYSYTKFYEEFGKDEKITYKIEMKNNQIYLADKANNDVKQFVENFRFLVQDEKFNDLNKYKKINTTYTSNVPLYTSEYNLDKNNEINKWVQKQYNISEKDATLYLEGTGNLKGSSTGDFFFEIRYSKPKEKEQYFSESITYQPTER
ncbi:tandem-type lipoprotein [Macrococcus sp. DPC7161]|uniref:tandem-type lipoprotein n=1 Tax=Macrococcus sp. DPC7161 TaxID=2507060 RepID=UPI00100B875C|nr:tandem-type lipoprotein [Macrococcus sp. DPC7161]RXK18356.1 tandem-type lipoprotein [Macrococcus sp. DPC7161]